jgi:hypothetical protein
MNGVRLSPLEDLIRMKLRSFRTSDRAHIIDLDEAGLITPDIETGLRRSYSNDCVRPVRRDSAYRSVSPNTKSMLPMAAITSAIIVPSTSFGVDCRLPKLGVRM